MYTASAIKIENGIYSPVNDNLTAEEMLSISVNGEPYTITMRSPGSEEALTRGILLSEDVYDDIDLNPVFSIVEKNDKGFITKVNVNIPASKLLKGIQTKRNLVSVSSCGMCGKSEMELALNGSTLVNRSKLNAALIPQMFEIMRQHQDTFSFSGGSHAAAAFTIDGELLEVQEDIGRHNAVDKVIGNLLLTGKLNQAEILLVSGRVSYEIVSKCFKAKIPFLAAVSAPSSLAVEYCTQTGITLLAFCRQNKCTVYTHFENVIQ